MIDHRKYLMGGIKEDVELPVGDLEVVDLS